MKTLYNEKEAQNRKGNTNCQLKSLNTLVSESFKCIYEKRSRIIVKWYFILYDGIKQY